MQAHAPERAVNRLHRASTLLGLLTLAPALALAVARLAVPALLVMGLALALSVVGILTDPDA